MQVSIHAGRSLHLLQESPQALSATTVCPCSDCGFSFLRAITHLPWLYLDASSMTGQIWFMRLKTSVLALISHWCLTCHGCHYIARSDLNWRWSSHHCPADHNRVQGLHDLFASSPVFKQMRPTLTEACFKFSILVDS